MDNEMNLKSAYDSLQKKELEQRKTIKQMSERIKELEAIVSKNESLHLVSQQRELLIKFLEFGRDRHYTPLTQCSIIDMVEDFELNQ